jgi:O-antigen ligase
VALLVPVLFIPISVDAYVLPRAAVTLAGGALLAGAGLVRGRWSLGRLRLPALAVALAAVAATVFSIAPAASLAGTYSRYESLPVRLAYLALFCGAAWLGERRRLAEGFLAGCGLVAAEAVYQALARVPFRPDGNLGQANLLGVLLAMAVPLALDRARTAEPPARRGWLALLALLVAGLAVTTSRGAWVAALAGAGVLVAFLVPRRRLAPVLAGGAVLAVAAAALLLASPLRHLNQDTGIARVGVWRDSLSVVADRPLLGWGPDTMGLVLGRHQSADWEPGHNFDRAHSMPLDLAATQGLLGLAACAWLFALWWAGVWRRRGDPFVAGLAGAAAAYLAWALVNFDWAPATAAFWLLAGAAAPTAAGRGRRPVSTPHPGAPGSPTGGGAYPPLQGGREKWRWLGAGAMVAAGLALAVPPLAADMELYAGHPDRAVALDPLQAHYHAVLGTPSGLRQAAALGDTDPNTYVALGDVEARAGHAEAARAAYREALARYPYDVTARQRLETAPPAAIASPRAASG